MRIRKNSWVYMLNMYTFAHVPKYEVLFILQFLACICLLPVSHSLYIWLLLFDRKKKHRNYSELYQGITVGSYGLIAIYISGALACWAWYGDKMPVGWTKTNKMVAIYLAGWIVVIILSIIVKLIMKIKFNKNDYYE